MYLQVALSWSGSCTHTHVHAHTQIPPPAMHYAKRLFMAGVLMARGVGISRSEWESAELACLRTHDVVEMCIESESLGG